METFRLNRASFENYFKILSAFRLFGLYRAIYNILKAGLDVRRKDKHKLKHKHKKPTCKPGRSKNKNKKRKLFLFLVLALVLLSFRHLCKPGQAQEDREACFLIYKLTL